MSLSDWTVALAIGFAVTAGAAVFGTYVLILTSGRMGPDPVLDKWARRCTRGTVAAGTFLVIATAVAVAAGGVSGWTWLAAAGTAFVVTVAASLLYEDSSNTRDPRP